MKIIITIIFVLLMSMSLYAYDIEGGRQTGMAGTIILSKPSAHGLLNCPTNNLYPKQFVIESVANNKYGLADLDQVSILAAYRFKNFTTAFGFSSFGTPDYYTEKNIRAVLSYHKNAIATFLITSGRLIEIGGKYGDLRAASVGLGVSYFKDNYYFGLSVDDINKPKIANNVDGENVKLNLFAEIEGGGKHSVTGRFILEKYEKPLLSFGQFINLTEKNGLFWGLSFNPLKYGGGFEVEYKKVSFVYGVSHHPVLGFSHTVSLSFLVGRKEKTN
jgi:hypothetical protein